MLVELAIGDAYGAGFEYANREFVETNNTGTRYLKHPRHNILPGNYTDDTQMTIAVAEVIVSEREWTKEALAAQFVEAFKRDPREGYAGRFYDFLNEVKDGQEFLAKIDPESDKSGGAMRACPIGVFPTIEEVLEKARLQAAITHNTFDGVRAAQAAALMTHYFLYNHGEKAHLGEFLETQVPGDWNTRYKGKVKSKGWMSVQAAVTAVMRNDSLTSLLKDCIAFTGDVDTVATIALGAGSQSKEIAHDLPEILYFALENGTHGRKYLERLDEQLLKRVTSG
jgi:ADP-ribosyl-[dinitrogen reductase] hydrolase